MGELLRPDICVVGAGWGGVRAAVTAAAFGAPVVLVEKGKLGGAHLYAGGLASAALMATAHKAETLRRAKPFGLNVPRPKVDFYQVHDHIQGVIATAAPNDSKERLTGLGVRVVHGTGRFKDARTLSVGDDIEIKARRFIIATGSAPAIPPISGIEETPYLTNETIFDLLVCPKHLAVIGATAAGLELAQALRRLGAEVTVLDGGQPLAQEDPECAAVVLDQLEREGIALHTGVRISRIGHARSKTHIFVAGADGEEKIEVSDLLIAAGRTPNVEELNLGAAGVKCEREGIAVDARLRTSNKRVYAVGDVAGAHSAHVAGKQAETAVRHALLRLSPKLRSSELPRATFTEPELAHVGLTEADVRQSGRAFCVLRWPLQENDRARAERQINGHIKVITAKGGKILGATIVGAQASELIGSWALAVSRGMNVRAIADLALPYPTLSEIGKEAAISYFAPALANPWIRRIMSIVRMLG
ncbi:MAG: FAD-dependent oxidoreductase [Xanthobacteraceae bacterium]